jgi:hypothetical protein
MELVSGDHVCGLERVFRVEYVDRAGLSETEKLPADSWARGSLRRSLREHWMARRGADMDHRQHSHYAGTVKLNDTYFNTAQYDTPGWRNLVSCQEVGHTLGLDHQDTNFDNKNLGTCMDYTSNPYGPPDNEHPDQHDYDELVTIYSHLDSTTTVGQTAQQHAMPPAMAGLDYDTPERWGKVIKGSRESGTSVHDLDFGHGNHIFTFVIWGRGAEEPKD